MRKSRLGGNSGQTYAELGGNSGDHQLIKVVENIFVPPKKKVVNKDDGFGNASAPERRGRQSALTDEQLHSRRDQLVQAFEGMWGDISCELQACEKSDDLALVFKPLAETFVQNLVEAFCRPVAPPDPATTLGKLRKEWRSRVKQSRTAEESRYRSQEQLQRVDAALAQSSGGERDVISQEHERCSEEAKRTAQEAQWALDAEREQLSRLQQLEAHFAREELFQFLESGRYRVEPLSLANAVAGLPYIGWRQSMKRCISVPRYGLTQNAAIDGLAYQIFKSICRLASDADKQTEEKFVSSFRDGIPLLPARHQQAKVELAQNWFYLERALREAHKVRPHPNRFPCEIQKRYRKQICSKSQADMVLAEHYRIELKSKKSPRKRENS